MSNSLRPQGLQHVRPPCPLPTPEVYSNSCPLSQWCHPTISSSVVPFSSCLQAFPASGSFQWVSSLHQVAKVLEFQLQHQIFQWIFRTDFLYWTGWISLQAKGVLRVSSITTAPKHQFFSAQLSLKCNSPVTKTAMTMSRTRLTMMSTLGMEGRGGTVEEREGAQTSGLSWPCWRGPERLQLYLRRSSTPASSLPHLRVRVSWSPLCCTWHLYLCSSPEGTTRAAHFWKVPFP